MQCAKKFASIRHVDCLPTPLRRAAYGEYISKKTEFQCRITFRLAGTKFFTQHSITGHFQPFGNLVEWLVVSSVGMKSEFIEVLF
jgi:hypothetical protein